MYYILFSPSVSEDGLLGRDTMVKLKKRVLALSRGINQAIRSHIVLRLEYIINIIVISLVD